MKRPLHQMFEAPTAYLWEINSPITDLHVPNYQALKSLVHPRLYVSISGSCSGRAQPKSAGLPESAGDLC